MRSVRQKYNTLKQAQQIDKACQFVRDHIEKHLREALACAAAKDCKVSDIEGLVNHSLNRAVQNGLLLSAKVHPVKVTFVYQ